MRACAVEMSNSGTGGFSNRSKTWRYVGNIKRLNCSSTQEYFEILLHLEKVFPHTEPRMAEFVTLGQQQLGSLFETRCRVYVGL